MLAVLKWGTAAAGASGPSPLSRAHLGGTWLILEEHLPCGMGGPCSVSPSVIHLQTCHEQEVPSTEISEIRTMPSRSQTKTKK